MTPKMKGAQVVGHETSETSVGRTLVSYLFYFDRYESLISTPSESLIVARAGCSNRFERTFPTLLFQAGINNEWTTFRCRISKM